MTFKVQGAGTLELVRESLVAVVSEMRANVIHSSYSSIIYEGHDFSCALVAADGRLVAQGVDDNPIHIFAVPYSTAEVVRVFGDDICDGDIFLHNDPYTGGTHLNDVLMLYPIFHEGCLRLFAATRCHWGDVGGMTPGSLSGAVREVYQEGLRITPTRIARDGEMNEAFLSLLFDNMRIRHERVGDFNTMLGTSRKAAEHVKRLFNRFGAQNLLDSMEELIDRAEGVMRERIAALPDGTWHAEGYLDNNGHDDQPLLGKLALTIKGDSLTADFTGSSPQTAGATNVGPAMAFNAVASIVKSFLDPTTAVNHGSFNPITIINPPGSFLNATLPAPCGGMVECRALMCALVVSALGQAVPDRLVGDLKGGANHVYISGEHPDRDGIFLLYEYPAGGTGATRSTDGNHAVRAFPEGDFNAVQSTEVLESQCPLRVENFGLREGSCGDGEFRGGLGLTRDVRVLSEEARLSVLADKNVIPPFGVADGFSGSANRFVVERDGVEIPPSAVPGKVGGFALARNDIVRIQSSGGGGYGNPLERNSELVASDVKLGYLSLEQARERYGVILTSTLKVDSERTSVKRKVLTEMVLKVEVTAGDVVPFDGSRRLIYLSPELSENSSLQHDDLVELSYPEGGASLRGWVRIHETTSPLTLSRDAIEVLGVRPQASVTLRPVEDSLT